MNNDYSIVLFIISGHFDQTGIKCSPMALEQSRKLLDQYQAQLESKLEERKHYWMISYLNVRSLYAHQHDVARDTILMSSDVFSLGETWLHPGSQVHFEGYDSFHASFGRGKGLSTHVRNSHQSDPITWTSEFLSVAKVCQFEIDMIFVYVSAGCNKEKLLTMLLKFIEESRPTVILGDFNENFSESSTICKTLKSMDFRQLIEDPTHDKGNTIDHVYVNEKFTMKDFFFEKNAAYYSDHDIISIYVHK